MRQYVNGFSDWIERVVMAALTVVAVPLIGIPYAVLMFVPSFVSLEWGTAFGRFPYIVIAQVRALLLLMHCMVGNEAGVARQENTLRKIVRDYR